MTKPTAGKNFSTDHVLNINPNSKNRIIIFIPGGPGLGFDYMPAYFQTLQSDFGLVFYNPGYRHGFQNISLDSLADELHGLVKSLADKDIGFVAHSGGAIILLEYFKKYGESPAALISWVTDMEWLETYRKQNPSAVEASKRLDAALTKSADPAESLRLRMLNYVDDYFPPKSRTTGRLELSRLRYFPAVSEAIEKELHGGVSARSTFACGSAPLLGLAGDEDKIIYPDYLSSLCSQRGKNLQFHRIPSAGHFGFIDNPQVYSTYLAQFFSKNLPDGGQK